MRSPKDCYAREELIAICEAAIVPQDKWGDRDSGHAHQQVGECWALLKAGCEFEVLRGPKRDNDLVTDAKTIWLEISFHGFKTFEYGYDEDDGPYDSETYYLPTRDRLKTDGGDWY